MEGKRLLDYTSTSGGAGAGGTGITSEDHRIIEIEGMFKEAYGTMLTEYSYVGTAVDRIDVWNGVDKFIKLFEKTFTYAGDSVQQVVLRDLRTGYVVTTTFSYDGGNLVAKHRILTQE